MMHTAWSSIEEVPYCFWRSSVKFQGHTGWKIDDWNPIWVRLLGQSQLSNPSDLPCYPCKNVPDFWTIERTPGGKHQWDLNECVKCFISENLFENKTKRRPFCPGLNVLTHWGRDKIAAIFQTTFSNAFSWIKMYEFRLRFHWSLLLRVQLTIFQHWFRQWLGADHWWTNDG